MRASRSPCSARPASPKRRASDLHHPPTRALRHGCVSRSCTWATWGPWAGAWRGLTRSRTRADVGVVSEQGATVGSTALLDWLSRAWPWVVGLSAAAGIIVGRALQGNGVVAAVAWAPLVGVAIVITTLAMRARRAVAQVRRAHPGALVIPGWATASTPSRLGDAPGTGPRPARLRAAFVATERSLALWRLDTRAEVIAFAWSQVAGVEAQSLARGPFSVDTVAIRLADGAELGLRPLDPWAGGPAREPDAAGEPTYADHLAARLLAMQQRSAAT